MPTYARRTSLRAAALAGALALLAACGGHRAATPAASPSPASTEPSASAIARARADSARLPWTAADAQFMSMMIAHHSQAITMSRMAPTHGASPSVRTLAERIINAQQDEIALMQRWLRERRQPVPDPAQPMGGMSGMAGMGGMDHSQMHHEGMDHSAMMPGMLTPAQLAQLDSSRGPQFDQRFLEFMIRHHEGAVQMVERLFSTAGAAQDQQTFKLATDVQVDQRTEIARMKRMLLVLEAGA